MTRDELVAKLQDSKICPVCKEVCPVCRGNPINKPSSGSCCYGCGGKGWLDAGGTGAPFFTVPVPYGYYPPWPFPYIPPYTITSGG